MVDFRWRKNSGPWTVVEGATLPYNLAGVLATDTVDVRPVSAIVSLAAEPLPALSIPSSIRRDRTVNITGATPGSVIAFNGTVPSGWTLNSAARTITISSSAALGPQDWALLETFGELSRITSGTSTVMDTAAFLPSSPWDDSLVWSDSNQWSDV
jgi:hypothetical protein